MLLMLIGKVINYALYLQIFMPSSNLRVIAFKIAFMVIYHLHELDNIGTIASLQHLFLKKMS